MAVYAAGWIWTSLGDRASHLQVAGAPLAALFAILGHMYPVWLRFKGGKGVATALGVFLALAPVAALSGLAIFIVVLVIWRYVSLASIVAAVAFPIAALYAGRSQRSPGFTLVVLPDPFAGNCEGIGRTSFGS